MKNLKLILTTAILAAVVSFSGCASKDALTNGGFGPRKMIHSVNMGNAVKVCIDHVAYISLYNGMSPALDEKTLKPMHCDVDQYGRVIPLP